MNSQELMIQVWREKFLTEASQCAAAWVEAHLQKARADALQKELDALKAPKKKAKAAKPALAAVA
jgi:hypothetical protein